MEKKLNESQRQIITVLRILSCMGVFAIHFSTHYGEVLPEIFNIAASFGQDGLWMFLILSGFLACCSGKNRLIDMGGVYQYYIGRAFRIVPLAYVWLLVIYLCNLFILKQIPLLDWRWLLSVFFLNAVVPTSDYYTWGVYLYGALSIFMCFYAAFPFIARKVRSYADSVRLLLWATCVYILNSTIVGTVLMFVVGGNAHILRSMGVLSLFWFISLGIYVYFAFSEDKLRETLLISVPIYLILLRYSFVDEVLVGCSIGIFMTVVLAALLLLGESKSFPVAKKNYFTYLERYTFPLFLCHVLIFELVDHYAGLIGWSTLKTAAIAGGVSCAVAVVLYHGVCVPAKLVEKRVLKKLKQ